MPHAQGWERTSWLGSDLEIRIIVLLVARRVHRRHQRARVWDGGGPCSACCAKSGQRGVSRQTRQRQTAGSARRRSVHAVQASRASALGSRYAGARAADGERTDGCAFRPSRHAPGAIAVPPQPPRRDLCAPRPADQPATRPGARAARALANCTGRESRYSFSLAAAFRTRWRSNSCRAWHAWARCALRRLSWQRCRVPAALRCVLPLCTAGVALPAPAGRFARRHAPRPPVVPLRPWVLRSRNAAARRRRSTGELHRWPGLPCAGLRCADPDAGPRAWT